MRRWRQDGAALLEATIAFPVLALFLMAVLQWGYIAAAAITLADAAATGARRLTVDGTVRNSGSFQTVGCGYVAPLLDPASGCTATYSQPASKTYQARVVYTLPLWFGMAVPTASGGVITLTGTATMR